MMGNVWEWNESLFGSVRALRGGSCDGYDYYLASSYRCDYAPEGGDLNFGFRVAEVPEPATILLLSVGIVALRKIKQ